MVSCFFCGSQVVIDGSYASALVLECGERSLQDMLEKQRPTDLPRKVCYFDPKLTCVGMF
jgi:hypothetical protein